VWFVGKQRAKARQGTAATLRVGEIRGSTKKARQQKGSGMARAGKKRCAHRPCFVRWSWKEGGARAGRGIIVGVEKGWAEAGPVSHGECGDCKHLGWHVSNVITDWTLRGGIVSPTRAPQWNKGYKPHGPRARDFSFKLNKKGTWFTFDPLHLQNPDLSSSKRVSFPLVQVLDRCSLWDIVAAVRALGLRVALSAKFLERNIIIVDNLQLTVSRHTKSSICSNNMSDRRFPPMYRGQTSTRLRGKRI
jgi:hypothetical protein